GACHISIGAEVDVELARTKRQHPGHAIGPGWPQCVAIPDNECRAAEDLLDLGRTQADGDGSLLAFGDRYATCGLGLSGTERESSGQEPAGSAKIGFRCHGVLLALADRRVVSPGTVGMHTRIPMPNDRA